MKNLKALLGLFLLSFLAIIVTGVVLNYLGIEHGPLLIKIGSIFIIVNIILYLLLLIFFVGRNLFRLYTEKRRKEIGSKFRTKLIVSFLGLVLTPSVLLFILSYQLINNSIDTWFSLEIQKPIYDSMDIAKTLYLKERQNAGNYSKLLASDKNILNQSSMIITDTGKLNSYFISKPDSTRLVKEAFGGASGTDILSTDKGDIIRAVSPVKKGDQIIGVVVVETIIPQNVVAKMESIQKSFNDYLQIKVQ
jgi:nitrogen fixation/metabolism regulation signal transduction histidine kinase